MARGSGKAFAIVVLIISLIIIAFVITELVYIIRLRNGVTLSSTSLNVLLFLEVIALVLLILILIWAIYQLARGSYVDDEMEPDEVVLGTEMAPITPGEIRDVTPTECGRVTQLKNGQTIVYTDPGKGCSHRDVLQEADYPPNTPYVNGNNLMPAKPAVVEFETTYKRQVPVYREETVPVKVDVPVYASRSPYQYPVYQQEYVSQSAVPPGAVLTPVGGPQQRSAYSVERTTTTEYQPVPQQPDYVPRGPPRGVPI
jgi:hypothetical protein